MAVPTDLADGHFLPHRLRQVPAVAQGIFTKGNHGGLNHIPSPYFSLGANGSFHRRLELGWKLVGWTSKPPWGNTKNDSRHIAVLFEATDLSRHWFHVPLQEGEEAASVVFWQRSLTPLPPETST